MPDTRPQDAMDRLSAGYEYDDDYHQPISENTGTWFFDDPRVKHWRDTDQPSILWLTSSPGQGKSTLAKTLATQSHEWWEEGSLSSERDTTTSYYFFLEGHARRMTAASAVCGLLHQLFEKTPYSTFIHQTWARLPTKRRLKNLLKEFSAEFYRPWLDFDKVWPHFVRCASDDRAGHFVCVLDGMDECDSTERRRLLQALGRFYSAISNRPSQSPQSVVKFFITSCQLKGTLKQDFEDLRDAASGKLITLIDADELLHLVHLDMESFINDFLHVIPSEYQEIVQQILTGNGQKTWLWLRAGTSLILNTLKEEKYLPLEFSRIDALLSDFPMDIHGVYEKALDMTSAKWGPSTVKKMLHILLAIQRRLSHSELFLAMELVDSDPTAAISNPYRLCYWQLAKRHPEQKGLVMGLLDEVLLRNRSTVNIIHKSAREFLLQKAENHPSTLWEGSIDITTGHEMLTRACLSFLFTLKMRSYVHYNEHKYKKPKSQRNMRREERKSPFLRYAAQYWPTHYNYQSESAAETSLDAVRELCTGDGPERNNWMYLYSGYGGWWWGDIDTVAHFSITPLVREVLDKMRDTEKEESGGRNPDIWHNWLWRGVCPLSKAVARGDIKATRILFDHGFILRKGCECNRSLITAARNGHAELVRLLLNEGADVDGEGEFHGTAMADACYNGHEEVIKILLDRGANVNIGLSSIHLASRNSLEAAAYGGHLGIVQKLLDRGIDTRAYGGRALWEAAGEGHEEIVRLLLGKGVKADVHYNSLSGSALCRAIRYGHRPIMQMLLDHGAGVTESEMKEALSKGNEEIAEMLLDPYIFWLLD
ncbi:ankyrin repeat-containing domain protein [Penicillium cataractarum]|uniref:Ankyrin repeat-containing domain protein n=1 Tax=Penicillium cataractarum TaxID=2100454 RepID=A0A9W9SK74_9EURO|nr:ankyrin repeat-containing domain protein [Penicillium cataractarum]KAJ5380073.1 ankyrin repeat-containing domain protein [Penicillium cataractarum]